MTHDMQNYSILYLKAESREALIVVLKNSGMWKDGYVKRYQGDELFERGTLYATTGVMLQGPLGEYPEQAPIPGYHADMTLFGEIPESLAAIRIFPNNPQFRFGGWKSQAELDAEEAAREGLVNQQSA